MPIWTSFFSWFRIWRQKCGSRITVWRPIKYRTFHHESLSAWRCLVNCDCNTMKTDDQELMDKLSIDRFWLGLFKKPWTKHKLILMLGCPRSGYLVVNSTTPEDICSRWSAATLQADTNGCFAPYIKNLELWKVMLRNAAFFPEFHFSESSFLMYKSVKKVVPSWNYKLNSKVTIAVLALY